MATQLSPFEVEHLISELSKTFGNLDLKKLGTIEWMQDHAKFEQLNRTAHLQAIESSDEYVVELVLTAPGSPSFLSKIVGELVSIQFWRDHIFPPLQKSGVIETSSSARSYLIFHHESVLLNFLEIALFNKSAVASLSDHVIDLVDLLYLKIVAMSRLQSSLQSAWSEGRLLTSSSSLNLLETIDFISYSQGLTSLNILRFLVDSRSSAPLTFTARILTSFDLPLLLVPMLDNPPWVRRVPASGKAGAGPVTEQFSDGQWCALDGFVAKFAAQILLMIYSIVLDPECMARYDLRSSSLRRDNLLRLRRHLTPDVIDQIPLLGDLLRALEELSISGSIAAGGLPDKAATTAAIFTVEIVPEFADELNKKFRANLGEIIEWLKQNVYKKESQKEAQEIVQALSVYDENFFNMPCFLCPVCDSAADQRCSACKKVFYCSRDCQLKHWPAHKASCLTRPST
jgi:hypothetical protein